MNIKVGTFIFPVINSYNLEDDVTDIYIGNPSCKPKPCIIISVDHINKVAIIQDITYYKSCNINNSDFNRGEGGMQLLVKASLKFLINEHPFIKKVYLTDKSYYNNIILPEKMLLTEGQTWYMKYFGAVPDTQTKSTLRKYLRIHKLYKEQFQALPKEAWNEKNIRATLSEYTPYLKNHQLSGSSWYITKDKINGFDIPKFEILQNGGGIFKDFTTKMKQSKIINIWRSYPN